MAGGKSGSVIRSTKGQTILSMQLADSSVYTQEDVTRKHHGTAKLTR